MKNLIRIIIFIAFIFITCSILITGMRISTTYRTEKDATLILKSIAKMEFERKDIIDLDSKTYITKSGSDDSIIALMRDEGWKFSERRGGEYVFKNADGKTKSLYNYHVYSSKYFIWHL